MRIGFIGLGHQGTPIAQRMAEVGLEPVVWARRDEALDPVRDLGVTIASSPADLASRCDVIGLCLFDAHGLDAVVFGESGIATTMRDRGHLVVHSTVAPEEIVALAARAREHGITVLDAPVSGGPAARTGDLVVIAGGDPAALEHCRPMMQSYASQILHVGNVGAAQLAKLVNNVIFTANLAVAIDGLRLGDALGLDPAAFRDVVRACSARSMAMDVAIQLPTVEALAATNATTTLSKDVALLEQRIGEGDTGTLFVTAEHLIDQLQRAGGPACAHRDGPWETSTARPPSSPAGDKGLVAASRWRWRRKELRSCSPGARRRRWTRRVTTSNNGVDEPQLRCATSRCRMTSIGASRWHWRRSAASTSSSTTRRSCPMERCSTYPRASSMRHGRPGPSRRCGSCAAATRTCATGA